MTLHSPSLAPDWKTVEVVRRGSTWPLGLRLRQAGVVVTASATAISVDIYKDTAESTSFASSGAITPADLTEYDLVTTSTEDLSLDWVARWSYTYAGVTYQERQRICIVGTVPRPRVDPEDLFSEQPDLQHAARLPAGQDDWTPQIVAAWYDMIGRLTRRGKQPWLSIDTSDLYHLHLYMALAKCCAAIPSAAGQHYATKADEYRAESIRRENTLTIEYETDAGTNRSVGPCVIPLAPAGRPSW
jgi:hypothetical protein